MKGIFPAVELSLRKTTSRKTGVTEVVSIITDNLVTVTLTATLTMSLPPSDVAYPRDGNGGPVPPVRRLPDGTGSAPSRVWSVTWNNPDGDWELHVHNMSDQVQYAVFGRETAPTTATPHLQGGVRFKRPQRARAVRRLFPGCHVERAHSPSSLFAYCKKEGDYVEFGRLLRQGERTDLQPFYEKIRAGDPVAKLFEDYPKQTLQYLGNIERIRLRLIGQKEREPPKVWWIYGSTGVGKTKYVHDREDGLWTSSNDLKWFDGYEGQEAVLIDDFRCRDVSYGFLLRLLDRYPLNVPIKGGFVPWVPQRIYVTCPMSPEEAFENMLSEKDDISQLLRRIHHKIRLS